MHLTCRNCHHSLGRQQWFVDEQIVWHVVLIDMGVAVRTGVPKADIAATAPRVRGRVLHNGRGIILRDRTGSDVGEGHLADMQTAAQNAAFEEGADAGGSEYMPWRENLLTRHGRVGLRLGPLPCGG